MFAVVFVVGILIVRHVSFRVLSAGDGEQPRRSQISIPITITCRKNAFDLAERNTLTLPAPPDRPDRAPFSVLAHSRTGIR